MKPSEVRLPLAYEVIWNAPNGRRVIQTMSYRQAFEQHRRLVREGFDAAVYLGNLELASA